MAFSLFLSFFERLNNSECDRSSFNFGRKFLPLVCVLFQAHEMCNLQRHRKSTGLMFRFY